MKNDRRLVQLHIPQRLADLLAYARRISRGWQDHEGAVAGALYEAARLDDWSIERCQRTVRTLLRAERLDLRRASQSVVLESSLTASGAPEADPEALDRAASKDEDGSSASPFISGPDHAEPLDRDQRRAVSGLRLALENELELSPHEPNWRAWARRVARFAWRPVDADRIAEAMTRPEALAPLGRQRVTEGWSVSERAAPAVGRTLPEPPRTRLEAQRRAGAFFTLCRVALAETQEHTRRKASADVRARDKFRATPDGAAAWSARSFLPGVVRADQTEKPTIPGSV